MSNASAHRNPPNREFQLHSKPQPGGDALARRVSPLSFEQWATIYFCPLSFTARCLFRSTSLQPRLPHSGSEALSDRWVFVGGYLLLPLLYRELWHKPQHFCSCSPRFFLSP